MNILRHELRKICSPKILLFIVLLSAMFYYTSNMPGFVGTWTRSQYHSPDISARFEVQLAQRFGATVTPEEIESFFAEIYPALLAEAEEHIRSHPIFAEAGIFSYSDFAVMRAAMDGWYRQPPTEAEREADRVFHSPETGWIGYRINNFDWVQAAWDERTAAWASLRSREFTDWMLQIHMDILENGNRPAFIADTIERLRSEAEFHISNQPIFAEHGITNLQEYRDFIEKQSYDPLFLRTQRIVLLAFFGAESDYMGMRLNFAEMTEFWITNMLEEDFLAMHHGNIHDIQSEFTERERRRFDQSLENSEYLNIMPPLVFNTTFYYFTHFSVLLLAAVAVLLLPYYVTDRARNVHMLQYSAKIGRKIILPQLGAMVISAIILTTLLLMVFGAFYATTGLFMYWNHGVFSFLMPYVTILPLNLGQYMGILIGMAYVISIACALIVFMLSRFSRRTLAVLLKAIPVFVGLGLLYSHFIFGEWYSRPFLLRGRLYSLVRLPGIEPIVVVAFMLLCLAGALLIFRRERGVDTE